jgi:predicted ATP-grasp superfamily ATP-dependent carboligase
MDHSCALSKSSAGINEICAMLDMPRPRNANPIKPFRVFVLGSSPTALAVVRDVHRLGGHAVVSDVIPGIAFHSRRCLSAIHFPGELSKPEHSEACLKRLIQAVESTFDNFLIATSDDWISFIIKFRDALEKHFTILHASNAVLKLCLNKGEFYHWCDQNAFLVPRTVYKLNEGSFDSIESDLQCPLMVKLSNRLEGGGIDFPKTREIRNSAELRQLRIQAIEGGFLDQLLISESLLDHHVVQYSVPFCRTRNVTVSYVARKERPHPRFCAVGTFVLCVDQPRVQFIAKRLVNMLGYYGVGELEILHDLKRDQLFIIELNARPWTQMSLSSFLGYEFIGSLITDAPPTRRPKRKTKGAWVSFYDDLYSFKLSLRLLFPDDRLKRILSYVLSLFHIRVFCYFCLRDPLPAFLMNIDVIKSLLRRHTRYHRQGSIMPL